MEDITSSSPALTSSGGEGESTKTNKEKIRLLRNGQDETAWQNERKRTKPRERQWRIESNRMGTEARSFRELLPSPASGPTEEGMGMGSIGGSAACQLGVDRRAVETRIRTWFVLGR